jgi:hypothetical protein
MPSAVPPPERAARSRTAVRKVAAWPPSLSCGVLRRARKFELEVATRQRGPSLRRRMVEPPDPAAPWLDPEAARRGRCQCLNLSTSMGGTRSKVEGGDRQTWNSKVCARTQDTRFIQVRVARVATLRLVWSSIAPCALVLFPGGIVDDRLGTRPSFI